MSLGQSLGSISGSGKSPGVGNGTPFQLFLPEKSHGQKSLAGYHPWGGRVGRNRATKHSTVDYTPAFIFVSHFLCFAACK